MLTQEFNARVKDLLGGAASLEERVRDFTRLLSAYLEGAPVTVSLFDPESKSFTCKASTQGWRCDQGEVRSNAAGTVDSLALEEERVVHLLEAVEPPPGSRRASLLVIPLLSRGERAGVVTVHSVGKKRLGDGKVQIVTEAVGRFAEFLVQTLREESLALRMTKLSALQEVGLVLLSRSSMAELLRQAALSASFILEAQMCLIRLFDPKLGTYRLSETHGLQDDPLRGQVEAFEEKVGTAVLLEGTPLLVAETAAAPEYAAHADVAQNFICYPLGEGPQPLGAVTMVNKIQGKGSAPWTFTSWDRDLLGHFARLLERAVRNTALLNEQERLRGFDHLTGLLNAKSFKALCLAEVNRAKRFGTRFILLGCEIASLEVTAAGTDYRTEDFIKAVATRIRDSLREYDVIARVGRTRFGIVLPEVREGALNASQRIEQIVEREKERLQRVGKEVKARFVFTQAVFPDDGDEYEVLTRKAGLAS